MPRNLTLTLLLLSLIPAAGCSRAVKESYYAVAGSSGRTVVISQNTSQLDQVRQNYGNAVVKPFSNEIGAACPPAFLSALTPAIEKELSYYKDQDDDQPDPFFVGPASKSIIVNGNVIHYDVGGVFDKALGPIEDAICRVRISDAQTGALLVEANCTGRVSSTVRNGPKEMAEGVAKAVKKLIKPEDD